MTTIRTDGTTQTFGYTGPGGSEGAQGGGQANRTGGGSSDYNGVIPDGQTGGATGAGGASMNRMAGPESSGAAQNRLEAALATLTDETASLEEKLSVLLSVVRDPDVLSKLMIEFASMSRQNALDARLAAREQARGELEAQAGETRESAEKIIASAIVSLVVAVVSAVISIGAAIGAIGQMNKATGALKESVQTSNIAARAGGDATRGGAELNNAAKLTANTAAEAGTMSQTINSLAPALNQLMGAIGGMISAHFQAEGKIDEAQGQELAAAATESQSNADFAKKFMEDLEEMIKSALAFLRELNNAETDMMASMTRV
ncbi:hypothetical protein [Pseudooceanicola aestuarii]|uniref:hypothetical protein n=1 Tax=Pseudooceanicola aestuarii TaxID=2697319 RepID=UPI0013D3FFC5|nr:hypothetical protein [Pseudooceanicola aestuarii]